MNLVRPNLSNFVCKSNAGSYYCRGKVLQPIRVFTPNPDGDRDNCEYQVILLVVACRAADQNTAPPAPSLPWRTKISSRENHFILVTHRCYLHKVLPTSSWEHSEWLDCWGLHCWFGWKVKQPMSWEKMLKSNEFKDLSMNLNCDHNNPIQKFNVCGPWNHHSLSSHVHDSCGAEVPA